MLDFVARPVGTLEDTREKFRLTRNLCIIGPGRPTCLCPWASNGKIRIQNSQGGYSMKRNRYCWLGTALATFHILAGWPVGASGAWTAAPYLMLDETIIVSRSNVEREVNHPSRLPDPIVTGYEDGCFQPWLSVVRDPQTRRFRMWYNTPATPQNMSESSLAYIESEDGIHWIRPHRVLTTPAIQFGASVIDDGPTCPDRDKRFKFAWWKSGGLQIAVSPDGISWAPLAPGVVLPTTHDITGIAWDPIRKRYLGLVSMVPRKGSFRGRRIPYQSVSEDLIQWKQPWEIITPDPRAEIEKGETQFYGMNGVVARGKLLIGMIKILRDDLNCEPGKTAAELHDTGRRYAGLGYTVLGWSHDGEHWERDTEPFLDRNPQSGAWDRAMTWVDSQLIVGDFVYFYYGGYRWGHKAERFTERQIGFAHMPRDRYVALAAGNTEGRVVTRLAKLEAVQMTVNARVAINGGELRVRILDAAGRPYPGFDWADCTPIRGDRVNHPVAWKANMGDLKDRPAQFEFSLEQAKLYAFDLQGP